jgi:hypothetical protein
MKQFQKELAQADWTRVRPAVEIKQVTIPQGEETYILCRSTGRKEKEQAMRRRFSSRMEEALKGLQTTIARGRLKNRNLMERRLGKIQARYPSVNDLYDVSLRDTPEGVRIQHFRNRGRFLQAPAAQGLRKARHALMKFSTGLRRSQLENFGFALRSGVLDSKIETASPQGIADPPFLVGGQHNEGNAAGLDGSQLRHAELPDAEQFQQHSLESVVYLVEFINQQDARPLVFQGQQEWAGAKESSPL